MTRPPKPHRSLHITLGVALASCLPSTTVLAGESAGHVNVVVGMKVLDSNYWAPVDTQPEIGIELGWSCGAWPVLVATDLFYSRRTRNDVAFFDSGTAMVNATGETAELRLGVRRVWNLHAAHPYAGAGLALVHAGADRYARGGYLSFSGPVRTDTEGTDGGFWLGGGVFWEIGARFNLGIAASYSAANVRLERASNVGSIFGPPLFVSQSVSAGGYRGSLLFGWSWPRRH